MRAPARGRLRAIAALSAAVAIAAGAFGAHGAADAKAAEWLRTGGLYQLIHGASVAALADRVHNDRALWLLILGAAIFAGTLYAMALGAPRILGAVTPIGGAAMIAGWIWIAVSAARR